MAQPRHPVTAEMWKEAGAAKGVKAPEFLANDSDGSPIDLSMLTKRGPVFLYFVQDGCPCSIEAQPHFERLFRRYRDTIGFVAVSDADLDRARKWKSEFSVPYSVIPMPGKEVMQLFSVKRSVYSMLIGRGQKILRMWPGYSAEMLKEANQEMAQAVGKNAEIFDPKLAPVEMTSGCEFSPGVDESEKGKRG
jgi:peroxiredoxin